MALATASLIYLSPFSVLQNLFFSFFLSFLEAMNFSRTNWLYCYMNLIFLRKKLLKQIFSKYQAILN